jgi:5-methylcytosine-specific restriction endonuclease McrA
MPVRMCSVAGCGNTVKRGRCPEHSAEQRKASRSPNKSFYDTLAWRMSRREQLFREPLCEYKLDDGTTCGVVADSVHHITPIEDGGARRDKANLMSVCRSHHTVIHRAMTNTPGRGGTPA